MIQVFQNLFRACASQEANGVPGAYVLNRDLVRAVRVELVNMNHDEEQEEFFIDRITICLRETPDDTTVTMNAAYVQHLKEFLQGAITNG